MLGKLIKYEFKASGRILLPIYLATMVLAVLSGFFYKLPATAKESIGFLYFITILLLVIYGLVVFAEIVISVIIAIYRFRTNLFDAEGYLMNTLPVKTHTHITSKLIVSVLYEIIGVLVAMLSGALFLLFTSFYKNIDYVSVLSDLLNILSRYPGASLAYMLELTLLTISILACTNIMFYASISVGHISNTKKTSKSVCAYLGFYFVSQIINFIIIRALSFITLPDYMIRGINAGHIFIIGLTLLEAAYFAAYFLITNYCMKNKLNLQ